MTPPWDPDMVIEDDGTERPAEAGPTMDETAAADRALLERAAR